jgi:DNA-binding FrmR family transcriptional regulator
MSHTTASKKQIIARVRRIAGQLNGVERALEDEVGCEKVLHLVAGARGAMNGLMEEILADFVREHVSAPKLSAKTRREAAEDLIAIIRRYAK